MGVSHKSLSRWYLQVSQSINAGIALPQALAGGSGPPARDRSHMAELLQSGQHIDDVLKAAPHWLPQEDRFLISAAATSGTLPPAFRRLSEQHSLKAENLGRAIFATLYPLGVLHFGIFLFPVFDLVQFQAEGGVDFRVSNYLKGVSVMLLPTWVFLAIGIFLVRRRSPIIAFLMDTLPALRGYRKAQGLADFSFTLESLIRAGAPMEESWYGAGLVSGRKDLEKSALEIAGVVRQGLAPGDYLVQHKCLPADFRSLYQTGEQTGQLEANLGTLARNFQEQANRSLASASFWYPKLMFLVLAIYAGLKILGFFREYLDQVMQIIE